MHSANPQPIGYGMATTKTDPKLNATAADDKKSKTYSGLTRQQLIDAYRTMYTSRRIDDREILLKRQQKIFFQIPARDMKRSAVAAAMALKPGYDWFYPYYRDRALCLALGVTPYEMFLQGVGAADDPSSGGRQMPSHWGYQAAEHRDAVFPDGHADSAGGGLRGSWTLSRSHPKSAQKAQTAIIGNSRTSVSTATRSPTSRSETAPPAKASSGRR